MALIRCPECGKQVSDKASSCPNCGCPLREPISASNMSIQEKKENKIKIIIPIAVVVTIVIIGIIFYNVKVIKPKNTYNEAIELLEKGKYEEADELLKTITEYKDVLEIREEIKYESYAYSAVNAVKEVLKNPDSISVYDVKFYSGIKNNDTDNDKNKDKEENDTIIDANHPCVIIHLGAQNGFGGNTESYASCTYSKNEGEYKLGTFTNELDAEEIDEDSDNYFMYYLGAIIINDYYDNGVEVGKINMGRFKTLLKNDAYSTIKIIE